MNRNRAILITGASTGIGRASALRLAKDGFKVFAGVRKKADGDALVKSSTGNLMPLMLDVTDEKMIARALQTVEADTGGELYGLLNNAGVGGGTAIELTPVHVIRDLFEVNVFGIFAVTKAFLPMLRKARGRVVNTSSAAGFLSSPFSSVYAASKFAVEAISDALRLELRPFGITVSILEPGVVQTEIQRKGKTARDILIERSDPAVYRLYEGGIILNSKRYNELECLPTEAVTKCVHHAFTAKKPKARYVIGRDAKKLHLLGSLPSWVRDYIVGKTIYG